MIDIDEDSTAYFLVLFTSGMTSSHHPMASGPCHRESLRPHSAYSSICSNQPVSQRIVLGYDLRTEIKDRELDMSKNK